MELPLAFASALHGLGNGGIFLEFAGSDHRVDARDVHLHNAPCADVEVADFAVAHLPVGESDEVVGGLNQGVGIFA